MAFSLARWRPRHLLAAWVAYWIALVGFALAPAIGAAWPILTEPDAHGTISAGFENARLHLTIQRESSTLYSASAHFLTLALWVAVPPLLLWAAWLIRRGRAAGVTAGAPRTS
jgi:hypothetical protein